ncbi:tetratricopeptide repeat protein [Methylobacillus glycogenes]|uniref:tetratricopeptide repeat protein n=1 Tax=Methylobacillus glycogenes TaxID=406 RepID=UPI0009E05FC6|nr:tetratricopeptide repeat protein [Methylobacillus glycogenes]
MMTLFKLHPCFGLTKRLAPVLVSLLLASQAQAATLSEQCFTQLSDGNAAEALKLAQQPGKLQRELLLCQGRAELALGQPDAAVKSFTKAEPLANNPQERAVTLMLKGNAYKAASQFAQAQESYNAALKLAVEQKSQKLQVMIQLLAGEAALQQGDFATTQSHYDAALNLAGNNNERADTHEHLAQLKAKQGLYDDAIANQTKAVVMQRTDGTFDDYANAGLELGHLYIDAKDYTNAERHINKVITQAREAGDGYWAAKGYYYIALSQLANQRKDEALASFKQALEISDAIGAEKLSAEVNLQLKNLSQQ